MWMRNRKTKQDYTQIYDLYKQTSMHLMWLSDTPRSVNKVNVNRACFDRLNLNRAELVGLQPDGYGLMSQH